VDLGEVAAATPGMVGADLKNPVNEAGARQAGAGERVRSGRCPCRGL